MKDCYKIKPIEELLAHLQKVGRQVFDGYQLNTNAGWVHQLEDGNVIFLSGTLRDPGLICDSKECFDRFIQDDQFPMDNPEQDMYDTERERIMSFHLQTSYYLEHLNSTLKLSFKEINKESALIYLKKIIGREIRKLNTNQDIVALIAIFGQLIKQETDGKWFLEKRYGTYNPKYEPNIRTASGNVILISGKIIGNVKWKVATLESIFADIHYKKTVPLTWTDYSRHRTNLIALE
jgi:hypothetical protein